MTRGATVIELLVALVLLSGLLLGLAAAAALAARSWSVASAHGAIAERGRDRVESLWAAATGGQNGAAGEESVWDRGAYRVRWWSREEGEVRLGFVATSYASSRLRFGDTLVWMWPRPDSAVGR